MIQSEFTNTLKENIEKSSSEILVDFGVAVCEQLMPDYIEFAKAERFGDVKLMRSAINFCKSNREHVSKNLRMKIDLEDIEENIPDVDESETLDATTAMNASCAIFELLEFMTDVEPDHILNIATYMIDTEEFKLSEHDATLTDEALENHAHILDTQEWLLGLFE